MTGQAEITRHGSGILRITPAPGVTTASIRDALRRNGVTPTIDWSDGSLFVPSGESQNAFIAMRDFGVSTDSGAMEMEADLLASEQSRVQGRAILRKLAGQGEARAALGDFADIERLDPHQVQAVAVASDPGVTGLCLFDEQGLGKTVSALFTFHCLRQRGLVSHALVLCPKNMVMEWERDATRFFPGVYCCRTVTGSVAQKRRLLDETADLYVSNFETPVRLLMRLKGLLAGGGRRFLLIIDESFYVKNPGALRSVAVLALRRMAARCMVLCGTPAPNRPHDLVGQFNIADQGATFRGVALPEAREEAVPVVRDVITRRGVFLRRLKQEALPDLPGRSFQRILLRMQGAQARLYAEMASSLAARLESLSNMEFRRMQAEMLGRRTRLLQICSNPVAIDDQYRETPAKLLALDSLLTELVEVRGEKVVIWCYFRASLDAIVKRYARYSPLRYDGKVSDPCVRRDAVSLFQNDPLSRVFVGNLAAAAAGLTLHAARYAIYESYSNQAAHYLQSLDRIHRRGQFRPVEYIFLLCDQTIEVTELDRLVRKEKMAKDLLGDTTTPRLTREDMIRELRETAMVLQPPSPQVA